MRAQRLLVNLLTLALLVGATPASTVGAEPSASPRGLEDALRLSWGGSGIREAAEHAPDSAEQASEAAYLAFLEREIRARLDAIKLERRQLYREYRRARAQLRGSDNACHRALLDQEYEVQSQVLLREAADLRSLLGYRNRQKVTTRFFGLLRSVAQETVQQVGPPGLIRAALTGGGDAARRLLVDTFRRVVRQRGKDALARALTRQTRAPAPLDPVQAATARASTECQGPADQAAGAGQAAEPVLNSGPFTIDTVLGYHEVLGRQAGAFMHWDAFAGEECSDFEAYNPHPEDPRNERLPGVRVRLWLDPDGGVFRGTLAGKVTADELGRGVFAGAFRVVIENAVVALVEDGWGWLLTGQGVTRLRFDADSVCADLEGKRRVVSKTVALSGVARTEGRIEERAGRWVLSLKVTDDQGERLLSAYLQEVLLAEVWP